MPVFGPPPYEFAVRDGATTFNWSDFADVVFFGCIAVNRDFLPMLRMETTVYYTEIA